MKRLIRMVKRWLSRRQWRFFWLGLPAILAVGLLLLALGVVGHMRFQPHAVQKYYGQLVSASLTATNYEAARVASLRGLVAADSEQSRADWLFYLALALNGLGRSAEAAALLRQAAPLDHPGSASAHLLAAQNLLISTNLNSETLRLAERHLLHALARDTNSLAANEMLGRFYINTRRIPEAQACLLKSYPGNPEAALLLAICFDIQKNGSSTMLWADRAITAIRKKLIATAPQNSPADRFNLVHAVSLKAKYDPTPLEPLERAMLSGTNGTPQDNPPVWLDLVRSLMNEKKFAAALATLEQAAQISPSPAYPPVMAEVCGALAESLSAQPDAERLQLIQKGLENNPQHWRLRWLLVQVTHGGGDSAVDARKILAAQIAAASGPSAAWWQFLLATDCRFQGDAAAAHQHLLAAYDLAPTIPEIQNDLAWELVTAKPQDLPRALELINAAVKQLPENPNFRDTRGRVLAALGRNAEAVADLKYAAEHLTGNDAKESLALLSQVTADANKTSLSAQAAAPRDRIAERLGKVQILVAEQNYAAALATLDQGMTINPNPNYANAIADVCVAAIGAISPAQTNGPAERLHFLRKGLGQAPEHPKLRALLVQTAHAGTAAAPAATRLLDQSVAASTGNSAVSWQLILGQAARGWGDDAGARRHFQAAYQLAPTLTQTRYEWATALGTGSQTDAEQGVKLMDSVLDQFPSNPEYRSTRGQMLIRLGRNRDAAKDLEFAVAHLADAAELRLTLAKVYDTLGEAKLAQKQRQLAQSAGRGN